MITQRRWLILGVLAALVSLGVSSAARANGPTTGRAGRSEVRFLEGMMDHHQMALDMSNDCLAKAKTDTVRTLCQNIITAQTAEIKTMQGWLAAWYKIDYKPVAMISSMSGGMSGMGGMMATAQPTAAATPGMATDPAQMMGMMAGLDRLQGRDYEIAWLESMIDHHDDAIHMAQHILKIAEHPELRDMAQKIIGDQGHEIQQMETMLVGFGDK